MLHCAFTHTLTCRDASRALTLSERLVSISSYLRYMICPSLPRPLVFIYLELSPYLSVKTKKIHGEVGWADVSTGTDAHPPSA